MPVEIKELIIRAIVDEAGGANNTSASAPSATAPEAMIQTCVERVLEILKDQKER